MFPNEPLANIEWRKAQDLQANSYNPNYALTPELELLARSILLCGWIQPILVTPDGTIIDGFHRYRLAMDHPEMVKRYKGVVPCAVLDVSRADAMLITVRMNRAKGAHSSVRMSDLVKELIHVHHYDPVEVAAEIGATVAEIELLLEPSVFTRKEIKNYQYSRAWVPVEDGKVRQ